MYEGDIEDALGAADPNEQKAPMEDILEVEESAEEEPKCEERG